MTKIDLKKLSEKDNGYGVSDNKFKDSRLEALDTKVRRRLARWFP
jgi:hypothetical protein